MDLGKRFCGISDSSKAWIVLVLRRGGECFIIKRRCRDIRDHDTIHDYFHSQLRSTLIGTHSASRSPAPRREIWIPSATHSIKGRPPVLRFIIHALFFLPATLPQHFLPATTSYPRNIYELNTVNHRDTELPPFDTTCKPYKVIKS
jgi:hypothetical protein